MLLGIWALSLACLGGVYGWAPEDSDPQQSDRSWFRCNYRALPPPEIGAQIIHRIIQYRRQEVRACYNRALARDPGAGGRIELLFAIEADGTVTHVVIAESEFSDRRIERCLRDVVRRWVFPVSADNTTRALVTYPFVFRPARSDVSAS